jgi:hypothetical protein
MGTRLKAFWAKLNTDVSELWNNSKIFVVIFGIIIVILKFRNVFMDLIVANAKDIFKDASQQGSELQDQENQNNQEADQLISDANEIGKDQPPISPDWNTKK